MTPEQGMMLARIDERTVSIANTLDRHEASINTLFSKSNEMLTFRSRIRGGMTVIGGLFTALLALTGLAAYGE